MRPVDPIPVQRQSSGVRRRHLSVALVRVRLAGDFDDADPADVDRALAAVTSAVRSSIEELGGTVATSIGSASLAMFGGPYAEGDDEARAVRAALALRDCFSAAMGRDLVVHIAVVTGEALVLTGPDVPPTVNGTLVDKCQHLLSAVPDGEVWMCERTRELTGDAFTSTGVRADAWEVSGVRSEPSDGHDSELAVVGGLLNRTLLRGTPHLLTVLGEAGEFLTGMEKVIGAGPRLLTGQVRSGDPLGAVGRVLAEYCDLRPDDGPDVARHKLTEVVRGLTRDEFQSVRLVDRLLPLLVPVLRPDVKTALTAWRTFLELAAQERPLVVLLRDVHLASEAVMDAVECMADSMQPVPLLVVVSARAALLDRRPNWGGGKQHTASITIDPPQDGTVERLRRTVVSTLDHHGQRLSGKAAPRRLPPLRSLGRDESDDRAPQAVRL